MDRRTPGLGPGSGGTQPSGTAQAAAPRWPLLLLGVLVFFSSGFSGLVFEIIWVRMAALGLGVTIWAVAVVVASFMAGLALGSAALGRVADRTSRCVQLYALLEVGIAASGLAATLALGHLPTWMTSLPTEAATVPDRTLQVALVFVILIVPCTMMGGTLPTMTRALSTVMTPGHVLGLLYGANTLGAVAAAFFTDWSLIPALGLTMTTRVAATLNIFAAGGALLLARALRLSLARTAAAREAEPRPEDAAVASPPPPPAVSWRALKNPLYGAYAISGLSSMGLQITWTRLMMAYARPSVYIYSVVLSVYLAGIALGSLLAARWAARTPSPRSWLVVALSGMTLASLASMFWITPVDAALSSPLLEPLLRSLAQAAGAEDHTVHLSMLNNGIRAIALFGIPTLLMGFAFPLAGRLAMESRPGIGRPLGELYAANTLGGIVGTLAAGFWILPLLGVQRTLVLLATLGAVSAVVIASASGTSRLARACVGLALVACLALSFLPSDTLRNRIYLPIWARNWGVDPTDVRYFADDSYGTVAVIDAPGGPQLLVNSTMMMGVRPEGQRYAQLMGHLPALLHENPRQALVICYGTGMTVGALSLHPEFDSVTCVELSPSVLEAAPNFHQWNNSMPPSPKVHYVLADGRNYLLRTHRRFDVITFEPPPPTQAGVVALYSSDYYRLCRDHLTPQGLVCQWVPLSLLDEPDLKMVIRAFLEVFPDAMLFEGSTHDYFLIGSPSPIRVRWDHLARSLKDPRLAANLATIGMDDPTSLVATYVRGPRFLRDYTASTPLVTDDQPLLEYTRWWRPRWEPPIRKRDLSELEPLLEGFTPERREALARRSAIFQDLLDFRGYPYVQWTDPPAYMTLVRLARNVMAAIPRDPYALYVLGVTAPQMEALRRGGPSADLAWRLLLLRRYDEAAPILEALRRSYPREACPLLWQSWAARAQGHDALADQRLREGLDLIPQPVHRARVEALMTP